MSWSLWFVQSLDHNLAGITVLRSRTRIQPLPCCHRQAEKQGIHSSVFLNNSSKFWEMPYQEHPWQLAELMRRTEHRPFGLNTKKGCWSVISCKVIYTTAPQILVADNTKPTVFNYFRKPHQSLRRRNTSRCTLPFPACDAEEFSFVLGCKCPTSVYCSGTLYSLSGLRATSSCIAISERSDSTGELLS